MLLVRLLSKRRPGESKESINLLYVPYNEKGAALKARIKMVAVFCLGRSPEDHGAVDVVLVVVVGLL